MAMEDAHGRCCGTCVYWAPTHETVEDRVFLNNWLQYRRDNPDKRHSGLCTSPDKTHQEERRKLITPPNVGWGCDEWCDRLSPHIQVKVLADER